METAISVSGLLASGLEYLGFMTEGGLTVMDLIAGHAVGQLLIAGGLAAGVWFIVKQVIPGQR